MIFGPCVLVMAVTSLFDEVFKMMLKPDKKTPTDTLL